MNTKIISILVVLVSAAALPLSTILQESFNGRSDSNTAILKEAKDEFLANESSTQALLDNDIQSRLTILENQMVNYRGNISHQMELVKEAIEDYKDSINLRNSYNQEYEQRFQDFKNELFALDYYVYSQVQNGYMTAKEANATIKSFGMEHSTISESASISYQYYQFDLELNRVSTNIEQLMVPVEAQLNSTQLRINFNHYQQYMSYRVYYPVPPGYCYNATDKLIAAEFGFHTFYILNDFSYQADVTTVLANLTTLKSDLEAYYWDEHNSIYASELANITLKQEQNAQFLADLKASHNSLLTYWEEISITPLDSAGSKIQTVLVLLGFCISLFTIFLERAQAASGENEESPVSTKADDSTPKSPEKVKKKLNPKQAGLYVVLLSACILFALAMVITGYVLIKFSAIPDVVLT